MRTPASSPSFTLSTSGSSLITVTALPAIAMMSGLDGLDVDISHGSMSLRPDQLAERAAAAGASIRSVWLPPSGPPLPKRPWLGHRRHRRQLGWEVVEAGSVGTVVVERPTHGPDRMAGLIPVGIASIRTSVPSKTRIAIGLRSSDLHGTRDDLIALAALRRYAEEWDVQLAIDLSGRVDPAWEVEAALMRLLPRLSVIRLRLPGFSEGRHGLDRTTARAVATLTDLRFTGTVAIVPSVRVWQRWWPPALAEATQASADALRERFASVPHAMEFESFRERPKLL